MDLFSLILPFAYLTILTASLYAFSTLYRRRKALQASKLEPWFPEHVPRNVYLTLLEQASAGKAGNEKSPKIPDSLLRAALLERSKANIQRLMQLRGQKPALMSLQQRGAIGDDLVQRFNFAEKEMEAELKDCVAEANALCPPGGNGVQGQGWGQSLFQSAGELLNQAGIRQAVESIEAQRDNERIEWVNRRKAVREGFLKEVGAEEKTEDVKKESRPGTAKNSDGSDDAVVVESPTSPAMERTGSVASSGDGSVAGEVTTPGVGSGGGGGGKKKKKNKKKT